MLVTCPQGLDGQRLRIQFPFFNPSISTLVRFSPAAGGVRTTVLPPETSEWLVPPAASWKSVARDYLLLGIEHIWAGIDHLFFVSGLLMLAKTARQIAVAVTGFTLAHSATLSLAALDLVRVPLPPIEAAIALSILFLAYEVARPTPRSLARRFPLAIASLFGLLHGFGFAAALSEAGLPRDEIVAALLFFNAGVEVGQLVFITLALAGTAAALRCARLTGYPVAPLTLSRAQFVSAYCLGIPASFWFFERLDVLGR